MSTHELTTDFEAAVLQASHERPILVDFWAAWCGPCQFLGPVLEQLAEGAVWQLVKVDTERHQDLAMRYRIRSIPAVKMFHRGEVVDEFTGALPEPEIRRWLDRVLAGIGAGGNEHDELLSQARELLRSDPARAHELAQAASEASAAGLREALLVLGRLLDLVQRGAETGFPGNAGARERYVAAARAFLDGRVGAALDAWIEVLGLDRQLDDDGARRAIIATFQLLGEEDPLTAEYRRRFSAALF